MRAVSFTEAYNRFKAVFDGVINDADTRVITCRNGEETVVLSLDD